MSWYQIIWDYVKAAQRFFVLSGLPSRNFERKLIRDLIDAGT
jgi:hypothetical protein